MNIAEFRETYPQYNTLSDPDLSEKLYKKMYSDKISYDEFTQKFIAPVYPASGGVEKKETPIIRADTEDALKRFREEEPSIAKGVVEEVPGLSELEAAGAGAAGATGFIASFFTGANDAVKQFLKYEYEHKDDLTGALKSIDPKEIMEARQKTMEAFSIEPTSESGKKYLQGIAMPFTLYEEKVKQPLGEWAANKYGDSPEEKENIKAWVDLGGDIALLVIPKAVKAIKKGAKSGAAKIKEKFSERENKTFEETFGKEETVTPEGVAPEAIKPEVKKLTYEQVPKKGEGIIKVSPEGVAEHIKDMSPEQLKASQLKINRYVKPPKTETSKVSVEKGEPRKHYAIEESEKALSDIKAENKRVSEILEAKEYGDIGKRTDKLQIVGETKPVEMNVVIERFNDIVEKVRSDKLLTQKEKVFWKDFMADDSPFARFLPEKPVLEKVELPSKKPIGKEAAKEILPEAKKPEAKFKLATEEARTVEGKPPVQTADLFTKEGFKEKLTPEESKTHTIEAPVERLKGEQELPLKEKIIRTGKPIHQVKFNPEKHSLKDFVAIKGGLNPKGLEGEFKSLVSETKAGKFLQSKAGLTIDDMRMQAIDAGFLDEWASPDKFLEAVKKDLMAEKPLEKVWSSAKDIEPEILKAHENLLRSEEGSIRLGKKKEDIKFTGEGAKYATMLQKASEVSKAKHKITIPKIKKALTKAIVDVSGNFKKSILNSEAGKAVVIDHDLVAGASAKASRDYRVAAGHIFEGLDSLEMQHLNGLIQARRTIAIEKYKKVAHPEGLGKNPAADYIKQLPKELRDKLNKKADAYFKVMHSQLKQRLDEGLITKDEYKYLSEKGDYSPREYLQHIEKDVFSRKITVGDSGIKPLGEGSLKYLENNAEKLMSQVISRTQGRIFRNRANKTLYDFAKDNPDNPVGVKLWTDIEKKAPPGYEKVSVMIDGKQHQMIMPAEMAAEWVVRDPIILQEWSTMISYLSGSKILKAMATGLNPEFALTNLPRDIAHIWLSTQEYSSFAPKFMAQIAKDLKTVSKDAITRKGRWIDYINEGGGMEFLTHQGRFSTRQTGAWSTMQDIGGYFGETSEIMTRLALRERAIRNGATPKKATWIARNYIDFSQGGNFTKFVDSGIPYLNASIQGTRGIFRAAKQNPKVFTWKIAQLGTVATSLYYANRLMNPEAWKQVSERDKVNNWIITTPFYYKDKSGDKRYIYFKIAKDQGQRVFASAFEGMAAKAIGDDVDIEQITMGIEDITPLTPTGWMPPVLDAMTGYWANKDFWRNEDIWKGRKDIEPSEEYTDYTQPAFVKFGQMTGLSPKRSQYALSQLFTSGNIYTSMAGAGWNTIMDELPKQDKGMVTEELILKQPFVRRFARATDPYNEFRKDNLKTKVKFNTEKYKLTKEFDRLSKRFYDGEVKYNDIKAFYKKAPREHVQNLRRRFNTMKYIKDIPNRRWWLELSSMAPEARATVYWNRWRDADKEEKEMLEKYVRRIPGISSDRFKRRFNILKRNKSGDK